MVHLRRMRQIFADIDPRERSTPTNTPGTMILMYPQRISVPGTCTRDRPLSDAYGSCNTPEARTKGLSPVYARTVAAIILLYECFRWVIRIITKAKNGTTNSGWLPCHGWHFQEKCGMRIALGTSCEPFCEPRRDTWRSLPITGDGPNLIITGPIFTEFPASKIVLGGGGIWGDWTLTLDGFKAVPGSGSPSTVEEIQGSWISWRPWECHKTKISHS